MRERLEIDGLTDPFDAEIWFGERVAARAEWALGRIV